MRNSAKGYYRLFRAIFLLLLTILLPACAGYLYQGEAITHATVRPAMFDVEAFRKEPTAVLPAVTTAAQLGYAPEISLAMDTAIASNSLGINYISSQTVISVINRNDLSEPFTEMIINYQKGGVLDRRALHQIAGSLAVNYVFLPIFAGFSQDIDDRLSLLTFTALRTYTTQLRLSLQLWNVRSGELVWQSSGQSTLAREMVTAKPVALSDVARPLWKGMLEDLLSGRTASRYTPLQDMIGIR